MVKENNYKDPYDWQMDDILIFAEHGVSINASQTGAGKSISAVETAKHLGAKTILLIAPKQTVQGWQETFAAQWSSMPFYEIKNTKAGRLAYTSIVFGMPGVYFINLEYFRTLSWENHDIDMVICDEIHLASNRKTQNAQSLWSLKTKYKHAMSGTLVRNKIENAWSILKWLYPDMEYWQPDEDYFKRHPDRHPDQESKLTFTKEWVTETNSRGQKVRRQVGRPLKDLNPKYFWQFAELFFKLEKNWFTKADEVKGELITGEVFGLVPAYVRHLKREQCCDYHPEGFATWDEPVQKKIILPMTKEQRRIYDEMEENQIAFLNDKPMTVELPITLRLRKAQVGLAEVTITDDNEVIMPENAKSAKLDWIIEQATEGDLADEQFVVFTSSQKFAELANNRLRKAGVSSVEWSGKIPQKDRLQAREDFIAGNIQVIVAVVAAAGTGLDGLQVANNVVFADSGSDGVNWEQALGRLDRTGQGKGVTEYYLLSEHSNETGYMNTMLEKLLETRKMLKKG